LFVTQIENQKLKIENSPDPLQLSLLNDYLYCPRRAALKLLEGCREENVHTARGDIVHEHTDLSGYESRLQSQISESNSKIVMLRALPVWSERLGLSGKCDVVEAELRPPLNFKSQISNLKSLYPVEFKLGRRRRWENDDAQLCAQALCLEEMFGLPVPRGAIFHADSKRRREVEFTPDLRAVTEKAVADLHALLAQFGISKLKFEIPPLPAAEFRSACKECSLYEICLPEITSQPAGLARAARELFEI
jgi:CRISPR-associated exonuclease Cas4